MAGQETSIFISVFIALFLLIVNLFILPTMIVSVLFIVVFTGFIASAMAGSENNSYKVGGISGGVLAVLFFIIKFFTAPTLDFNLYGLNFSVILLAEGMIYLILSFIISLAIFMFLGAFGGLVAQELFGPKEPKPDERGTSKTT